MDPVVEAPRLVPLAGPPLAIAVARERGVAAQVIAALWRALGRRQGALARPPRVLVATRELVLVDPARIAAFRSVCGFGAGEGVPVVFPEILFHPLIVEIVLSPAFPLSPLGLVHVRQRIRQVRPLEAGERVDLRCALAEIRSTGRGIEADLALTVDAAGGIAWEGVATLVSRGRGPGPARRQLRATPPADTPAVEVDAPAGIGRRYAEVSGDWNPHHVWPIAARLVGFRAPIAHGLWTLARALAVAHEARPQPAACVLDAAFKRPVLLPGRLAIRVAAGPDGGQSIEARDPATGAPHLAASLTPLEPAGGSPETDTPATRGG